jgi:hypothetical protein
MASAFGASCDRFLFAADQPQPCADHIRPTRIAMPVVGPQLSIHDSNLNSMPNMLSRHEPTPKMNNQPPIDLRQR